MSLPWALTWALSCLALAFLIAGAILEWRRWRRW